MGRLLLLTMALCGLGIAMSGSRSTSVRVLPAAGVAIQPIAPPAVAYRPGEPSLTLGDAATLKRDANGHFTAEVDVGGQTIEMVVDTGATAVALTISDAQRLGIVVDPTQFRVVGSGASGPVRGQIVTLDDVAVGGRHVTGVAAAVVEGLDRSLLGQSYLRRLDRVAIDGDTMTLR